MLKTIFLFIVAVIITQVVGPRVTEECEKGILERVRKHLIDNGTKVPDYLDELKVETFAFKDPTMDIFIILNLPNSVKPNPGRAVLQTGNNNNVPGPTADDNARYYYVTFIHGAGDVYLVNEIQVILGMLKAEVLHLMQEKGFTRNLSEDQILSTLIPAESSAERAVDSEGENSSDDETPANSAPCHLTTKKLIIGMVLFICVNTAVAFALSPGTVCQSCYEYLVGSPNSLSPVQLG